MSHLQRSRRLQAGLSGLGILAALGVSFNIAQAPFAAAGQRGTTSTGHTRHSSRATVRAPRVSHRTTSRSSQSSQSSRSSSSSSGGSGVSAPQNTAPQATTSGS